MSKVDTILDDELDPEDLDPTPRGGTNGRNTDPKKTGKRCPTTPPPVRASCDEPAAWCHRGAAAEAVQR